MYSEYEGTGQGLGSLDGRKQNRHWMSHRQVKEEKSQNT